LQHKKLLTLLDNVRKTRNVFSSGSSAVTYGPLTDCPIAVPLNRRLAPSAIPNLSLDMPRPGCGVLQPAAVADSFVFD